MSRKPRVAAIILAAGAGTRMRSALPKVLHPLCGRPMIDYPVRAARDAGLSPLVAVLGPKMDPVAHELKQHQVKVVIQPKPLGTGHAVTVSRAAFRPMPEHLVIVYADAPLVTSALMARLVQQHLANGASCTMVTAEVADPAGYGRVIRDDHGRVAAVVEETSASVLDQLVNEVNTGIACVQTQALFAALREVKPDRVTKEIYLPQAFLLMGRERPIDTLLLKGAEVDEARGINTPEEFSEASRLMRLRLVRQHAERGVTVIDPQTTYIEDGVEIGAGTVIRPFTFIERGVRIGEECVVGPLARLRQGAVLERGVTVGNFVEIVRSRIGERTKVLHHAYLGDATVGKDVNIGAGTVTANYDGTNKLPTLIEDGAFIGSGTILVAPAIVRRHAVTGAGAVVTRNTDVPPGATYVGVPAKPIEHKPVATGKRKR